jgi:hypothetical protein
MSVITKPSPIAGVRSRRAGQMIRLAAEYKYSFDMLLSARAMAGAKVRRQRLEQGHRLPADFNEARFRAAIGHCPALGRRQSAAPNSRGY